MTIFFFVPLAQTKMSTAKLPLNKSKGMQRRSLWLCLHRRRPDTRPIRGAHAGGERPKPRAYAPQ